jgi:signal transduction histidine kinase
MSTASDSFCAPEVGETNVRSLFAESMFVQSVFVQSWFVQPWFANAPLCFAQLDQRGRIHALNPRLRQIVRESCKSEVLCLLDLLDPEIRQECDRLMQDMFHGRRNNFQLRSSDQAHGLPAMRWSVWRVPGRNRPDWALALADVIEDRAEDEDSLCKAMRLEAVGRLTAGVVHDFNNLLIGVLLYCDLLLASLQGNESRKYAEEIRSAGIQAAGMVRQLLNVARPGMPQVRLLSLNEVIEAVHDLLCRLMRENIELQLHLDPKLGLVRLDYTQAQQILLNLALNARDAMPCGGRIVIETANCEIDVLQEQAFAGRMPCILLTVRDNGTGMDTTTRARLFEPFFTTKGSKGTGLGLAGVHGIVTSNGGLVHVDSALGKGTRVRVLLPFAAESTESHSTTQTSCGPQQQLLPLTDEV